MRALVAASAILGLSLSLAIPGASNAAPPEKGTGAKVQGKGQVFRAPNARGPVHSGPKFSSGPKFRTGQSGKIQSFKSPGGKFQTFKSPKTYQALKTPGGKLQTLGKHQAFPQKHAVVYRPWHRKRYYGRVFGGVLIGSILAASAYYALSAPPDPDLCWYWADPSYTRGYWDFCDAPPPDWY
jgi:hypothetical protein